MNANKSLLSSAEKTTCENISSQRTLEGKRAKALLALNDGDTQVIAAKKSGLTYGQVKYLLSVFRKQGISIISGSNTGIKDEGKTPKLKKKVKIPKSKEKEKTKRKKEKKSKKKTKSKKDKSKEKKKNRSKNSKKSKKK